MDSFKPSFRGNQAAWRYFIAGYRLQTQGRLEEALFHYRQSLDARPTAEAMTFYGWALSALGRLEEAIDACKQAIGIDRHFGNPYNDIGAYLIELGRPGEAIAWLEKAIQARRYDAPHFPYVNMGAAYESLGQVSDALLAYKRALSIQPDHPPARKRLLDLIASLN